ncbi:hypothetical protein AGOR_G00009030 [Albula goreensis]|uniref:Uncharacterized protein n=1 Tax=Albula goreensis TaxID=1534307 RepID=A0A8T3E645_9TELE|nr:hypothetical protein AGOR_G00009030 [Albula goreensis]
MQFSKEDGALEGTFKSKAHHCDSAGAPSKMCSECYTNQTFVYDDGTAHEHTARFVLSSSLSSSTHPLVLQQPTVSPANPSPAAARVGSTLYGLVWMQPSI